MWKSLLPRNRQYQGLGFRAYCRRVINKPPPLNRDSNRDPNTKARKRTEFVNTGSTLQR